MMRSAIKVATIGWTFIFLFFINNHLTAQMAHVYEFKSISNGLLSINGKGDNAIWNQANTLTSFMYPWNEGNPPPMTFQGLHDKDWIYGLYRVHDPKKILIYTDNNKKSDVLASDRVEIFFRKDDKMETYYGLELDPKGRIYDYRAHYHRQFNPDWTWPKGQLIVKAELNPEGYTLEFAVSKKSLKKLGMIKGDVIEGGLYRGECVQLNGDKAEFKWISWVKPDSETPNFHIPSSFGILKLMK